MVIMASPRSDSISSPKKGGGWKQGGKLASGKAPARGAPNLLPPPKYELREDWPVDGPIDMAQVRSRAAPRPLRNTAFAHGGAPTLRAVLSISCCR